MKKALSTLASILLISQTAPARAEQQVTIGTVQSGYAIQLTHAQASAVGAIALQIFAKPGGGKLPFARVLKIAPDLRNGGSLEHPQMWFIQTQSLPAVQRWLKEHNLQVQSITAATLNVEPN